MQADMNIVKRIVTLSGTLSNLDRGKDLSAGIIRLHVSIYA